MDYWFGVEEGKQVRSKTRPAGYLEQAGKAFVECHKHMDEWVVAHGVTLQGKNKPFTTLAPLLPKDGEYETAVSGDDTTALEDNDEGLEEGTIVPVE